MADLPLDQVPLEGEITEVLYRLSRPAGTHLDLTVSTDDGVRRLRFNGVRVVMFQEEPPPVLKGLEVQDIRDQQLRDLALWVSVADGAITFWAKSVSEMAQPKPDVRPKPRDSISDDIPLASAEQMRSWSPYGIPPSSFRYQPLPRTGALRGFTVKTRRYV